MPENDIVERLRANTEKYPGFENMNTEAAATIETLRAEVKAWRERDVEMCRNDADPYPWPKLDLAIEATDAAQALGKE